MPNKIIKTVLTGLLIQLMSWQIFAQREFKPQYASRIIEPVEIDGLLNEPAWAKSPEANELMQVKGPEEVRTSIKILYDDIFIYFGFLCYDPEPDKIEALVTEKDKDLRDDDSVYVLIDTIRQRNYFYYFATNLNSVQLDGRVSLDGRVADTAWDGAWKRAAQKTDFGWSVEFAIDLTVLGYEAKKDKAMGISLSRIAPRMRESSFFAGALDPAFQVSQLGQLEAVDLARAERKAKISPHVIMSYEQGQDAEYEAGLDFRYDFSRNAYGRISIYPDFATVEADEEVINLTRYELFIPEKREFFLEGSSVYDQDIRLFYSKRIHDIDGGVKLYGRSGAFEFSGISAQAQEDVLTDQDPANFSAVRFRTDFLKSSFIGILASNKSINGRNIGAAGVDTLIHFTKTFSIAGQYAYSYGISEEKNIGFFVRPSYQSKNFRFHIGYFHLEENFGNNVNEVGYIKDDNRRELDSRLGITFLRDKGNLAAFRYDSNYNAFWGMDKELRSWQVDQGLIVEFKSKFALSVVHTQEFKAQDDLLYETDFRNHQTTLGVSFNAKEWEKAFLAVTMGKNFGWNFNMLEVRKNLHVTPTLDMELMLARTYFTYGRSGRNDFLHSLKAINYFSEKLFVKLFYQIHTRIDKFNVELLINYYFLPPLGYAQLVYQIGRARFGESYGPGNTLFLKVGYTF
ncbi:MAG: DUF5916 domain-containing protein [Candidatus Aminicenantes bacterium]|jgi:hypothetical protein